VEGGGERHRCLGIAMAGRGPSLTVEVAPASVSTVVREGAHAQVGHVSPIRFRGRGCVSASL
jgi:hypothetical protein